MSWPIVAVHLHMLPTGKVMFYPYNDESRLWDPANPGVVTTLPKVGYNIFCTGHSFLADGRLLVTGGHVRNGFGLPDASIYDPFTNSWTRLADMNDGRWYPTNTTLASGEVLVISGSKDTRYTNNTLPQVWTGSAWRDLTGAQMALDLYPAMHLAPNGKVFMSIPAVTTRYIDTSGTGSWTTVGNRPSGVYRGYGSAVLYDDGKVIAVGGGDPPVATAEVIDLSAPSPAWRVLADTLASPRRQINATLLADGKVLVTGGSSLPGFNEPAGAVHAAEVWDPATEQFTTLASCTRYRGYHSTAVLLPDARVLCAGGDNEPNAEIFSPPYLFQGARPAITSAPASVTYGQTFFVGASGSVNKVHWIRISSVTHATNMDQRINRLAFSPAPGGVDVTAPSDANLCPPGHYMLFLLDSAGVPSVASIIRIGVAAPAAPTDLTAVPVSRTRIDLSWTDNSSNEDQFKIERSSDGVSFTQIATVGANVTSYSNNGLRRNTTYHYRVRASNSGGNSAYSNVATATTLP
jgi:hypothetical protein